ncbi:MAG: SPOR domain-containing protein [Gammaproteobacteria bacterium]|nr:SPOR domain-containing protein [Gammaproteobacteria bacterium]
MKQVEPDDIVGALPLISEPLRDAGRIILLSEVNTSLVAAQEEVFSESKLLVRKFSESLCLTTGPFGSADEASSARLYLASIGLRGGVREEESVDKSEYWVFIPSYPSLARARAKLKQLQDNGFDSSIVTQGVNRYAVSLGIFKNKNEAKQHLVKLEGKIRDIELGERIRTRTKYWLDIEYKLREVVPEELLTKLVAEDFSEVDVTARDCQK